MKKNNIVAGLEIGCTKVSMVALEKDSKSGAVSFVGSAKAAVSNSVRKGSVVNLDNVTEGIVKVTEDISQKNKRRISSVFVNISGPDIKQEISHPVTALPQRSSEISQKNIDDLLESCKIVSVPLDRHLLYLFPLEYMIDGQDGVKNPKGLYGSKLEADVLMVTAPFNQVQNIVKAVNFAGLDVERVVLTGVGLSNSVLSEDDKKKGVLLIDMKTDITEFGIFKEGALLFFDSVARGQADIINEIAARFDVPYELAMDLKKKYAFFAGDSDGRSNEGIPLDWMGKQHSIVRSDLNKVMISGLEAVFGEISGKIRGFKGFNNIVKGGAVICGGTVAMEGFVEWAASKLGFSAKEAASRNAAGVILDEGYMTALGLAELGLKTRQGTGLTNNGFLKSIFHKTGELLADYF
ncbi:MAG: cell division protein FtsA [Candidatus Omnitrophica bacterium]|nr:cell division protein FtsA [Candidatus Omnitrophota bacterium]